MHGDRWSKMGSPTIQRTAFSPTATGSILSDPGPWQSGGSFHVGIQNGGTLQRTQNQRFETSGRITVGCVTPSTVYSLMFIVCFSRPGFTHEVPIHDPCILLGPLG